MNLYTKQKKKNKKSKHNNPIERREQSIPFIYIYETRQQQQNTTKLQLYAQIWIPDIWTLYLYIRDPVVLNVPFWTENAEETTKFSVCCAAQWQKTLSMFSVAIYDLRCSSKSWIYTKNNSNARTNLPTLVHLRIYSLIGWPFLVRPVFANTQSEHLFTRNKRTACVSTYIYITRESIRCHKMHRAARRLIHIPLNTKDIWVSGYVWSKIKWVHLVYGQLSASFLRIYARYIVIWLSERVALLFSSQVPIWILHFCHARAPFCRCLAIVGFAISIVWARFSYLLRKRYVRIYVCVYENLCHPSH